MSGVSESDYRHAQRVWTEFNIKNLGEYYDLYLKTDAVLLENVFETFRETSLAHYGLDPPHFFTLPGLAWKACLKKTNIRLALLSDPDMLLMFQRGIRGGITQAVHRYASANNKYMESKYDPNQKSTYIQYLDATNLYGLAMSQPLPTCGFKWVDIQMRFLNWLNSKTRDIYQKLMLVIPGHYTILRTTSHLCVRKSL